MFAYIKVSLKESSRRRRVPLLPQPEYSLTTVAVFNDLNVRFMKPAEFDNLTTNEKARMILSRGVYVSKSEFFQLEISLYRIDDVFVELWYEPINGRIFKIDYLKNKKINPYLKHLGATNLN